MNTQANSASEELHIYRQYNKKELCFLFGGVSLYHLNRMIASAPVQCEPMGRVFSPRQIMALIKHYGLERTFAANQEKIK